MGFTFDSHVIRMWFAFVMATWPLIGWDILYFFSETAEGNLLKLDKKQELDILYQVCVFLADWKAIKIAALASDWLRHFDFFSETAVGNLPKVDRKQELKVLFKVYVLEK